jgi:DNA replication and repair protein RecF
VFLRELWLWNFRNYEETSLSFQRKNTLLLAKNSQGKTNLLEAIYYLSSLSSPRCSRPQEMIRHGTSGFSIKGRMEDRSIERELTIFLGERERGLWIGGKRISQPSRYWSKFPAVMFSPDDLALITEAHDLRRRFLDRCAALEDAVHLQEATRFRRILMQRNRLLKVRDTRQLSHWDEQLASSWEYIYRGRSRIVSRLNAKLPSILRSLGGQKEPVVRYRPVLAKEAHFPPPDLTAVLREGWDREMSAGFTLFGPHRDEVIVELGGYDARRFSSRGEIRLLTLSLKLFELAHLEQLRGEPPLVLLDDLFPELDEEKRTRVASRISGGGQALVTCTDLTAIQPLLPEADVYEIHEGRIKKVA